MKKRIALIALLSSFLWASSLCILAAAEIPKAGAPCLKSGATAKLNGKKYTCIKSGKKLIWDKGVPISASSPLPNPEGKTNPNLPQVKKNQTLNFDPIPNSFLIDRSVVLSVTSSSGLDVQIKTESSVICRYKSETSELLFESPGLCVVTALQPGNEIFNPAAPVVRSFQISKQDQVIQFEELETQTFTNEAIPFSPNSNVDTSLTVSVVPKNKNICTYQSKKIKLVSIGICELQLNQNGNRFYNPAPQVIYRFEIVEPSHEGTVDDPQNLGSPLTKNGITITALEITDEVSDYVCETELVQDGCEFGGVVDPESYTRYVRIDISVENDGDQSWMPSIYGLYLDDQLFSGDFIEEDQILANYELEVGESANLSLYVALDKEIELTDCLLFISESVAEEAFYFKLK